MLKKAIHILAGLALATAAASAAAQAPPKVHLKMTGLGSNQVVYKKFEQPFWSKEITEKTGGAVTVDIHGLDEMGLKGNEIGRLIKNGVIDGGSAILGWLVADDMKFEAIDLPGLNPDIATVRRVTDAYRPVLDKVWRDRYNAKLLAVWPSSAQVVFCKTPISSLADLKGKKIRTSTRTMAEFVDALGGTGVTLSFGEVLQALQTSVVDCAITGIIAGYSSKYYEAADYVYAMPLGWSQVGMGVGNKTWNRINPKTRDVLLKEVKAFENRQWDAAEGETNMGFACATGSGTCTAGTPDKMKLIKVSPADTALVTKLLNEVTTKKWAERCGKACTKEFNETIGAVVSVKIK